MTMNSGIELVRGAATVLATPALAVTLFWNPLAARPQGGQDTTGVARTVTRLDPVNVTATRRATDVFATPKPVDVLDRTDLRELQVNTVADLLRRLPGTDVTGVGVNQVRPTIRGQRGQRILLLQDGLRLNNSRRQQDFGELPALVDVSMLEQVEVVRGPASVLYGSDAIGGVINLITRVPSKQGLHGAAGYRYSTHDEQQRVTASLGGRFGRLGVWASGSFRDARSYEAPAGSFGDITLDRETRVFDTGGQDDAFDVYSSYDLGQGHTLFARYERYRADTAGFGYVDPAAYAEDQADVQILYPFQRFDKLTAGYRTRGLGFALADRVDIVGYAQDNDRRFDLNVSTSFGPSAPPGAGVDVRTQNFTDVTTYGVRAEAQRLVGGGHLFTYGVDFFNDDSNNTDSSVTVVTGFGPPMVEESGTPLVPNATFRSFGAFAQGDFTITDRASMIVGARYQEVRAATEQTPGISDPLVSQTDRTVVAAANGIYRITDGLSLIAAVGRAFRSPNLVERFFNGPTPEGSGFQARNPDLEPETSFNVDVGARYRNLYVDLEAFVFRNEIRDGIRIAPTGNMVAGLPEFQNVNVEKLRYTGVEVAGEGRLPAVGLTVGGTYTHLSSKDALDPSNPVGDSFSSRVTGRARYQHPSDRFWIQYDVRHNGERRDIDLGTNPLGPVLPSFTVHNARLGVLLFRQGSHTHRVNLTVANLANELYAEFANASFFRPEPQRSLIATWNMSF